MLSSAAASVFLKSLSGKLILNGILQPYVKPVLLKVGLWKQIGSHANTFWNVKCCSIFHFFSVNMWTHQVTATSNWNLSGSIYGLVFWDWFCITNTLRITHFLLLKLHHHNTSIPWNYTPKFFLRCDTVSILLTCDWWRSQESLGLQGHLWGKKKKKAVFPRQVLLPIWLYRFLSYFWTILELCTS